MVLKIWRLNVLQSIGCSVTSPKALLDQLTYGKEKTYLTLMEENALINSIGITGRSTGEEKKSNLISPSQHIHIHSKALRSWVKTVFKVWEENIEKAFVRKTQNPDAIKEKTLYWPLFRLKPSGRQKTRQVKGSLLNTYSQNIKCICHRKMMSKENFYKWIRHTVRI